MEDISKGGSYVLDPKTGAAKRVEFTKDAKPEPIAAVLETEEQDTPALPAGKGSK